MKNAYPRAKAHICPLERPKAEALDYPEATAIESATARKSGLRARREDGRAALAQADGGMAREFADASEDDLVAVGQKGAGFACGKFDGIGSVTGEFEETACGCFGGAGDSSGGEDVSGLEIAAVAGVMGYELGRSPIEILSVTLAQ